MTLTLKEDNNTADERDVSMLWQRLNAFAGSTLLVNFFATLQFSLLLTVSSNKCKRIVFFYNGIENFLILDIRDLDSR